MKPLIFLLMVAGLTSDLSAESRDPFWPIGVNPTLPTPTPEVPGPGEEPEDTAPRELSDDELRQRTQDLAEQISKSFTRRATMVTNGKIYAHVGKKNIVSSNPWVTEGDQFTIEILGNRYRMEVTKLTRNRIELEPHRVSPTP